MNLNLDFPAEIEQALQHQATLAGLDLSSYIRELVTERLNRHPERGSEELATSTDNPQQTRDAIPHAEFQSRLKAIIAMHPRSGHVDDSRESIYAGRGE